MRHFVSFAFLFIFTTTDGFQEPPAPTLLPRGGAGEESKSQQSSTQRLPGATLPNRQTDRQLEPGRHNLPPISTIPNPDPNSGRNLNSRRKPQPKIQEVSGKKSPRTTAGQQSVSTEVDKPLTRQQAAKRHKTDDAQKAERVPVNHPSGQYGRTESERQSRGSLPLRQNSLLAQSSSQHHIQSNPEFQSTRPAFEQRKGRILTSLSYPNEKRLPILRISMPPPRARNPSPPGALSEMSLEAPLEALNTGRAKILPQHAIRAKSPSRETMRMIPIHTISPTSLPISIPFQRQPSTNIRRGGIGLMSSNSGSMGSVSGHNLPSIEGQGSQTSTSEHVGKPKESSWS